VVTHALEQACFFGFHGVSQLPAFRSIPHPLPDGLRFAHRAIGSTGIDMTEDELTAQFIASMPAAYAQAFDDADAGEHARIVNTRGSSIAQVEVWRMLPQGVAILCVVADDRPGLVALVSAAFLAHALDVRSAQIYCRNTGGRVEAVDFFWLRNVTSGTPLDTARLEACARTIRELLGAETDGPDVLGHATGGDDGARVSYTQDSTALDRFEVVLEARDFPGLLHTVARLLHQHGLEVVRCEIRTEEGIARDRFWVTSFNGGEPNAQLSGFRAALLGVIAAIHKS
jgi:UTP:GlnB (protein PII) uridylyltransferase